MRKTNRSPRKANRPNLPLRKETVRTLDSSELTDVQTGLITRCPTTMSTTTQTQDTKGPGPGPTNV
jgi:hypothetical protein